VLRYLAERHQVTLLSFVRSTDTHEAVAHLGEYCERVLTVPMPRSRWRDGLALLNSLFTGTPFLIARDWVPEMSEILHATLRHPPLSQSPEHREGAVKESQFDFLHADQLWMAQYALSIQSQLPGIKLVLDQHNAVHLIPHRLADGNTNPLIRRLLWREARLMAHYEAQTCTQFDQVVWVTDEDREAVHSSILSGAERSRAQSKDAGEVIPICVDPSEIEPVTTLSKEPTLLFLGGMHWPPNADGVRWFLDAVWPQVKARLPSARMNVIGKDPPSIAREIEEVHALGYVHEVSPYWQSSRVFIVPLRAGGGMRVKIMDAWARGLPVVSTTIGAEGIDYCDGEDILIADDPKAFAEKILHLLRDDTYARKIGRAGRRSVIGKYNWKTVYQRWHQIYSSTDNP